ncbi:hypothetical protein FOZ61_003615 [Perkinsus olseni]|uniref:Protein ENHANCED DISEASE RESISTANCE 2 C-terminal domain-containing protein n=1 Tax=Perkinsus olseni TaxID=32597 RepID=A0A7J6LNX2_PEROL|nr:hypothetical protein FOZ61_003615 [Perkinsus olseni]
MSFSPWVQQQYLVRAEKDKAKQQRGMRLIRIHLAPLYRFLGGEAVYKAVSFCNAEFLARWESGDVDPDSVLQRCRGVFPTVLETVVIIRSAAAAATLGASSAKASNKASHRGHSKSGDGDVAQRSRSGSLLGGWSTLADRRKVGGSRGVPRGVVSAFEEVSLKGSREDVTEFLSSSLVHAHWVHRKASSSSSMAAAARDEGEGMGSVCVKPSKPTAAPSEGLAAGAALDDEEEEVQPVEFPPLGAELELDVDQYYSASEGEESDGEAEKFRRLRLRSGGDSSKDKDASLSSPKMAGEAVKVEDVLGCKEGPQQSDDETAENTWGPIDCSTMNVRGGTYLVDRLKQPSEGAIMKLESFDLFYTDSEVRCAVEEPRCVAHWLWKQNPERFFFIINWRMFPLQLAVTYSVDLNGALFTSDEPYAVAFRRYIQLNDADRNSKLKVIPRVVEGPWLVKKAVGQTPTIIGRKLVTEHHSGVRCVEASIDVFSSVAAKHTLSLVVGAAKKLVIDVGFVIEGQCDDELPERLIGGFRIRYPDLTLTRKIHCSEQ